MFYISVTLPTLWPKSVHAYDCDVSFIGWIIIKISLRLSKIIESSFFTKKYW